MYGQTFLDFVATAIGRDEKNGQIGQLRTVIHKIEPAVDHLVTSIKDVGEKSTAKRFFLLFVLLLQCLLLQAHFLFG